MNSDNYFELFADLFWKLKIASYNASKDMSNF